MVKDIRPGNGGSHIAAMAAFGDKLLFSASDLTVFGGLWISDGTEAGTKLLRDISTQSESISFVHVDANRAYFFANHQTFGRELWVTDGTTVGTYMIADINPHGSTEVRNAQRSLVWDGKLYFWATYNEPNTFKPHTHLYVTDGSQGNLTALTDNNETGGVLLDYDMIVYNDRLYFTWHSPASGVEMWSTDGTRDGTVLTLDINPEVYDGRGYSGWPKQFQIIDDTLIFFAYEQGQHTHMSLWSTDGTPENTQVLAQVVSDFVMEDMVALGNHRVFSGRAHSDNDFGLWMTDGTVRGTVLVHGGVTPDFGDSASPDKVIAFGNKVLFQGESAEYGTEPWITDGTTAGTFLLKDIHPGPADSPSPTVVGGKFTIRGDKAYFVAAIANEDFHLFETDGTSAGTRVIAPDVATVTDSPLGKPGFLKVVGQPAPSLVGDILVFSARYTNAGSRLYRN